MKHIFRILLPACCVLLTACGTPSSSESEAPAETTTLTVPAETTGVTDAITAAQTQETAAAQSSTGQENGTVTEPAPAEGTAPTGTQPSAGGDRTSASGAEPQEPAQSSTGASGTTFDRTQEGLIELPRVPLN
ncbi:MAG: hypothetical protein IJ060_06845 [Oscillospiraceae bacterium]|nr:hypothetical protein [Oscillospiraceae bacterium]